jgi:hypothetical protein
MLKISGVILLLTATAAPTLAEDNAPKTILFNRKVFVDMGDTVHVEGQVTGEGIGYKVNRSAMTCYRDRRECILTHVDTQGLQAFSIGPPLFLDILKWDKDLIIADIPGLKMPSGHPCGGNPGGTTWYIHRDTQITVIQENFCSLATGERGFYSWTIEEDPFYKTTLSKKPPG